VKVSVSLLTKSVALHCARKGYNIRCNSVHPSFARILMMGFGLLSLVVASLLLLRQKDIKRLFAYSSIEHMGIITFAFGMGGPIASFAGLLHMTVHSLTKSAIFFAVGHAVQKTGTQLMDGIRGLVTISPAFGLSLKPSNQMNIDATVAGLAATIRLGLAQSPAQPRSIPPSSSRRSSASPKRSGSINSSARTSTGATEPRSRDVCLRPGARLASGARNPICRDSR